MNASRELMTQVESLAKGTPYVVEGTDAGFDVRLDTSNARCYALLHNEGIKKVFTHHVTVDESGRAFTITDDAHHLDWQLDSDGEPDSAPKLSPMSEHTIGRAYEFGARTAFAWNERGEHGKVLEFALSSNEGHGLIRTAAESLGLEDKTHAVAARGTSKATVSVIAAIVVLALIMLVVLLFVL